MSKSTKSADELAIKLQLEILERALELAIQDSFLAGRANDEVINMCKFDYKKRALLDVDDAN